MSSGSSVLNGGKDCEREKRGDMCRGARNCIRCSWKAQRWFAGESFFCLETSPKYSQWADTTASFFRVKGDHFIFSLIHKNLKRFYKTKIEIHRTCITLSLLLIHLSNFFLKTNASVHWLSLEIPFLHIYWWLLTATAIQNVIKCFPQGSDLISSSKIWWISCPKSNNCLLGFAGNLSLPSHYEVYNRGTENILLRWHMSCNLPDFLFTELNWHCIGIVRFHIGLIQICKVCFYCGFCTVAINIRFRFWLGKNDQISQ